MATMLRQVLDLFEHANGSLSLAQAARALGVTPGALEGMIQHWVRKGRLREVTDGCGTCGSGGHCPFTVRLPRRYELAGAHAPEPSTCSPAACCHYRPGE